MSPPAAALKPLGDALESYLGCLFGGASEGSFIEIRTRVRDDQMRSVFVGVREAARAAEIIARDSVSADVYVGVAPRVRRSGKAKDVRLIHAAWADCDSPEAIETLGTFIPPPSITIHSGRGIHAYWLLGSAGAPSHAVVRANTQIAEALGSDPAVSDAARILRPPGTQNFKHGNPRPVCLQAFRGEILSLEDVVKDLRPPGRHLDQVARPRRSSPCGPICAGERNTRLTRIGGGMRRAGCSEAGLRAGLHAENRQRAKPPLRDTQIDEMVRTMARWPAGRSPLDKPATLVADKHLTAAAKLVLVALIERADHTGFVAPVGMRRLGDTIGESASTVHSAIQQLQKAGRVQVISPEPRARNAYRVNHF